MIIDHETAITGHGFIWSIKLITAGKSQGNLARVASSVMNSNDEN